MCLNLSVYMQVCVRVCTNVCICARVFVLMYLQVCMCLYVQECVCVHVCLCNRIGVRRSIYVYEFQCVCLVSLYDQMYFPICHHLFIATRSEQILILFQPLNTYFVPALFWKYSDSLLILHSHFMKYSCQSSPYMLSHRFLFNLPHMSLRPP